MNTLHSSLDMTNVPRPGGTVNLLGNLAPGGTPSDSDRIRAMLAGLDTHSGSSDPHDDELADDFIDDDELGFDLDTIPPQAMPTQTASRVPQPIGSSGSAQQSMQAAQPDLAESGSVESDSEEHSEGLFGSFTMKHLVGFVAIISVIVIIAVVRGFMKPGVASPENTQSIAQPAIGASQKFVADILEATDAITYMDSMVIEKYIVLEQDTCRYVFEGYAENARAFLLADVDLSVYNTYKTGARVQIVYERITLNGKDYYMKVRVTNEN